MSRHRNVRRMISTGGYEDDYDEDQQGEEEEVVDNYADSNFTEDELMTIHDLLEDFKGEFTKKSIIDALYETDGNYDKAYDLLSLWWSQKNQKKPKKETKPNQQKQTAPQQANQKQQQQPTTQPTLLNQNSKSDIVDVSNQSVGSQSQIEEKKQQSQPNSKHHYQIVYNLEQFNSQYPPVQYNNLELDHRSYINLVVVGHVDSGKSTLIGKLMHSLQLVDDRDLYKTQKEAKHLGKESFFYAHLSDSTKEEKERGVTMDIGYKLLKLNDKYINLLDSPGHKEFVPHMITGACQADYALLVIDAGVNAFEGGFIKGGQTKEHSYLVRALGVRTLIIAINKMDLVKWSKTRYDQIKDILTDFLTHIGFQLQQLSFIPLCAFKGENLQKKSNLPEIQWYEGLSLFEAIDNFEKPVRSENRPPRLTISNCYTQHEGKLKGTCIFGQVEAGHIEKGQAYVILPQGIQCIVKDMLVHDQKVKNASSGSIVDIQFQLKFAYDYQNIKSGDVLSSLDYPIPVSNLFVCEIVTLELDCPIIKGLSVVVHINGSRLPGQIKKLLKLIDKQGNLKKNHPRTIQSHDCAEIEVEVEGLICLETFKNSRQFGKVILREKLATIAVGKITEIKLNEQKLKQTQSEKIRQEQNMQQ